MPDEPSRSRQLTNEGCPTFPGGGRIMRGFLCRSCIAMAMALSLIASGQGQAPAPKQGPEMTQLKDQLVGTWEATVKGAGFPDSTGTMTYKLDLGGMWLSSNYKGNFAGAPFEGKGPDTYDAESKKLVSIWVDSMSTSPMISHGELDKTGQIMTMAGEMKGPDGKMTKTKTVSEMTDKDNMVFKMYGPGPDGKEGLMMTITYKRKK